MPARKWCISVWFHWGLAPRGRHVSGCFLNPLHVSLPKRTELSKSSTLTKMRHRKMMREMYAFDRKNGGGFLPASTVAQASLAFSGSNQARKGRLVNALAVRGDEGRDTLR